MSETLEGGTVLLELPRKEAHALRDEIERQVGDLGGWRHVSSLRPIYRRLDDAGVECRLDLESDEVTVL